MLAPTNFQIVKRKLDWGGNTVSQISKYLWNCSSLWGILALPLPHGCRKRFLDDTSKYIWNCSSLREILALPLPHRGREMVLWRHCFKRQPRFCSCICTYSSLKDMLASTTFHKSKKTWTKVATLFEIAAPWGNTCPPPSSQRNWFYGDTASKGNQDVALASVPTAPLGICSPPLISTEWKEVG